MSKIQQRITDLIMSKICRQVAFCEKILILDKPCGTHKAGETIAIRKPILPTDKVKTYNGLIQEVFGIDVNVWTEQMTQEERDSIRKEGKTILIRKPQRWTAKP